MLSERIKEIRKLIASSNLKKALDELESYLIGINSGLLELAIVLKSRWKRLEGNHYMGLVVNSDFQVELNNISFSILYLLKQIDNSERIGKTLKEKKSKGRILYNVKKSMPINLETRCTVRLSYDLSLITQNFDVTQETVIQEIRISDVMEVELIAISDDGSFKIRSINSKDQIVDSQDYTEWIFWVMPLKLGNHKLLLKVSVIQIINEVERKKEVVLEKNVKVININKNLTEVEPISWTDSKIIIDNQNLSKNIAQNDDYIHKEKRPELRSGGGMNWGKLLGQALVAGVVLKGVSDVDAWLNDQINAIKSGKSGSLYVEMAYEIAKMNNNQWQYLIGHLKVKSLRNDYANHVYQYCNYVVGLENNSIKELMSYSISDASDVLSHGIREMKTYEIAAHYGVLKAKAQSSMKAKAIFEQFNQLLLN